MLKFMTKKQFKEAVDESRLVVSNPKGSTFEVHMITVQDMSGYSDTPVRYGLGRVVNPDTKDGNWRQTGGGYNKSHACIEDIAWYVDHNAEDKDDKELSCISYWATRQRMNEI